MLKNVEDIRYTRSDNSVRTMVRELTKIAQWKLNAWVYSVRVNVCTGCKSVRSAFACNPANCCPQPSNVLALCLKNATKIYRNPWLVIFQFLIPTLQVRIIDVYLYVYVITPFGVVLLVYPPDSPRADKPQHHDKRCNKMFITVAR